MPPSSCKQMKMQTPGPGSKYVLNFKHLFRNKQSGEILEGRNFSIILKPFYFDESNDVRQN